MCCFDRRWSPFRNSLGIIAGGRCRSIEYRLFWVLYSEVSSNWKLSNGRIQFQVAQYLQQLIHWIWSKEEMHNTLLSVFRDPQPTILNAHIFLLTRWSALIAKSSGLVLLLWVSGNRRLTAVRSIFVPYYYNNTLHRHQSFPSMSSFVQNWRYSLLGYRRSSLYEQYTRYLMKTTIFFLSYSRNTWSGRTALS